MQRGGVGECQKLLAQGFSLPSEISRRGCVEGVARKQLSIGPLWPHLEDSGEVRKPELRAGAAIRPSFVLLCFSGSISLGSNNIDFGCRAPVMYCSKALAMNLLISSLDNPGGGYYYYYPILQLIKWRLGESPCLRTHLVGETAGI